MKRFQSTKFIACFLGLVVTFCLAWAGKMDGNVTMALSVVVGGYYTSNAYVTGKAVANGKPTE